jgi:iron complex transport system ATP-binding protein
MLKIQDLFYTIYNHEILKGISVSFKPGSFSMIIGPNGSGKSTLLKNISGDLKPDSGAVFYDAIACVKTNFKTLSQVRATLSQQSFLSFPLTVEEVVMMGRYPHFELRPSNKDKEIVSLAIEKLNISHLRHNNYLTLSGGEKQRVNFAKCLSQIWEPMDGRTRYLLLDEPISSLDPNYQHEFLTIANEYAKQGVVVVAVMHDVNLASKYGNYFVALKAGKIIAQGQNQAVMNSKILSELYEIPCFTFYPKETLNPIFVFDKGIMNEN